MELGNSTVLDYVVQRCKLIESIDQVIVATSNCPEDDSIAAWCSSHRVQCFRGSEEDVLSRYYECAKTFQPKYVMRVTADCPFVDFHFANMTMEAMKKNPSDIVVNRQQAELTRGLSVELLSFSALERIYQISTEGRHREHVTFYAYEFPEQFTQTILEVPASLLHPNLRLTIDTPEDYELCKFLSNQWNNEKTVRSEKLIAYLLEHPEIARINAHISQKPVI